MFCLPFQHREILKISCWPQRPARAKNMTVIGLTGAGGGKLGTSYVMC
jgi:phosphoheptose isomerase